MDFSRSLAKSKWNPPLLFFFICLLRLHPSSTAVEILSKSKLERCVKTSNSDNLNCEEKVVINMVVPSGSSGGEASIVAELVEVEENDTLKMQTIRVPPIITINKSAAYALYDLSYLRDVAYKPEEFYAITRKCEPDASSSVVKICERLRDQDGHIIENTEEVVMGPENRTVLSNDNFLRVNLVGDFVGYTSIPSFEDFYLVTPRLADMNRMNRNQPPQYVVEGRFERINQHPNAGTHSFSVGISEVLNTNLLIELSADDIEYVYQRSPGKILSINVPTFEALTQFGTAVVTTKNIGKLEASYSLTFDCLKGVSYMEEQFYIMKADEVVSRSFHIYPTTDQAGKYECAAILKASDFTEVDRAGCQFTTTATVLDNGSQIMSEYESKGGGLNGFFQSIKSGWKRMWDGLINFFTGKTCRSKCSSFFDFSCHLQYVCVSWILMFGLLLAIFPTVIILLWLLHQKGFFDPLHDWWDDRFGNKTETTKIYSKYGKHSRKPHIHHHKDHYVHHKEKLYRKKQNYNGHRHLKPDGGVHHVHKETHKHKHKHKLNKHEPELRDSSAVRGLQSVAKHHEEMQAGRKRGHTYRKELYSKPYIQSHRH